MKTLKRAVAFVVLFGIISPVMAIADLPLKLTMSKSDATVRTGDNCGACGSAGGNGLR